MTNNGPMTNHGPMTIDWRALLRDFPNRPGAWRVLAINLVPLVGVVAFGWSTAYVVFAYWLDLLLSVMAITAVLSVHAIDETAAHVRGPSRWAAIIGMFLFVTPIVGMPTLVPGGLALGAVPDLLQELATGLRGDLVGIAGFAVMAVLHAVTVAKHLGRDDRRAVRDELREGFGLVIFKSLAACFVATQFGLVLMLLGRVGQAVIVAVLAAVLTAAEVYRREVLRAMRVDRAFHDDCERPEGTPSKLGRRGRRGNVLSGLGEAEKKARGG